MCQASLMQPFICRGPVWRYAGQVQITITGFESPVSTAGFPVPDLIDHFSIQIKTSSQSHVTNACSYSPIRLMQEPLDPCNLHF